MEAGSKSVESLCTWTYGERANTILGAKMCGYEDTFIDWASQICEQWYIREELKHLHVALQADGYLADEIRRTIYLRRSHWLNSGERLAEVVMDRIGKLLYVQK